jgi:hypothetical protein
MPQIYQLDIVSNTLVVAMVGRLFNIRKKDMPAQQRDIYVAVVGLYA